MDTNILRPTCVNMGNHRLIGADKDGCQIRYWIVGEKDMRLSRIVYTTGVNGG